ncbi:MAG: ABC transporter permease [Candidatus Hydrogenedens sp.]|nr:ABC transporter permease [Candidatus Hydrogenedentota bacterium]NLF57848.1 ABC transporter permease [Candidatus Hydrogenedens sp.]
MRRLLRITAAEYAGIVRNPAVLLIFIAGLAIYALLYPLPYSGELLRNVPVVPVDLDNTSLSRKLIRWTDATEEVGLLSPSPSLEHARGRLMAGDAGGVLVVPEGFERAVLRGEDAVVSAYADATWFLVYRQALSGIYKAAATLSAGVEIRRHTAAGLGEKHALDARDPLPVVVRPLFNPAGGYATYIVPAVLMLILQQTLLIGIGTVGGARNETFLTVTGAAPAGHESALAVLVGRALAYFSLYILYPVFYLAVVYRVYGLPSPGNPLMAVAFTAPFVLSVTLLGMAMGMLFHSRDDAVPALIYTSVPAVFLMGFAWPLEAVPAWLRAPAMLIPCVPGAVGFVRINQMGATLREVLDLWMLLWAQCALYGLLAWFGVQYRPGPGQAP